MCYIRGLYHPRSFLVFSSANDRPLAPRARRSCLIAFGPMPWSCLSSVSLTLVNCLTEIYRSRFFSIKAGIEECMRIFQGSALKKVHFYCFLESADSTNKSLVRPYRGIPLPFLSDVGVGLKDKFAQSGEHLAAPVGKFCDLFVDTFRWIQSRLSQAALHCDGKFSRTFQRHL